MVYISYENLKEQENFTITKCSATLPPELLIKIFCNLLHSQRTLHTVSLVCKQWLRCVVPILYSYPRIGDTYRWATFILTLTRDKMSCFYGNLIRSVDLSSGKSIESMRDQEFYKRLSDATENQYRARLRNRRLQYTRASRPFRPLEQENDFIIRGLPYVIVTTSSLIQLANTCRNLTSINLSYTSLLNDSKIQETGEYVSTLQHYAMQPGLTHIQIPITEAIQTLGRECQQLKFVSIQRCEWVTAYIIWMFAYYCPNLIKLDARRSTKCSVKRLISRKLEVHQTTPAGQDFALDLSPESVEEEEEEPEVEEVSRTIHFVMNEAPDVYEQVRVSRHTEIVRQLATDNHNWPYDQNDESVLKSKTSMRDIVHHIILDAETMGAMDLTWIHDY